jgi:tetratricopeptide (TPR) repeat protein
MLAKIKHLEDKSMIGRNLIPAYILNAFILIFYPFISQVQAVSPPFNLVKELKNTIGGHVFDQQRRPIANIYVELQNEVYSTISRTRTDGSGRYLFSGLSSGRFSVRVLPYGTNLEEQTQEVEIVNFVAPGSNTSENAEKDFYLRVHKDESEPSAVTGIIFVQDIPEQAQKLYKEAISSLDNNKVEAGVEELQNTLKLFPDYYLALERLGNEFIKQQKYQDAQEIYKRAVSVNSRSYASWYGLSYANYGLKQSENAIEAAEKAIFLNSNSVEALLMLGISQRQAKRYENAEKTLKKADKLAKGKSSDVHWNLALLYVYNFKRYNAAADELELYLKTQSNVENEESIKKLIKQYREKPNQ